jgi:hypothetical protein
MSQKTIIPNPERRKRLVANLRQTRFELQDFGLQLEELLASIEKEIRDQKLERRTQKSTKND